LFVCFKDTIILHEAQQKIFCLDLEKFEKVFLTLEKCLQSLAKTLLFSLKIRNNTNSLAWA
jgi:hypothetical protein